MTAAAEIMAAMPTAVAARISAVMPDLRECGPHEARITLEEVKRGNFAAPAVRVAALDMRFKEKLAGPAIAADLDMAAYVVTKTRPGLSREHAAMAISQTIFTLAIDATWGEENAGPAERVLARNLSNTATRAAGIGLWAVTWTQPLMLSTPPEAIPISPAIYLGIAPEIGPGREDDYELVAGGEHAP